MADKLKTKQASIKTVCTECQRTIKISIISVSESYPAYNDSNYTDSDVCANCRAKPSEPGR